MKNPDFTEKDWYQSAVFYQIYPRSFQDSDGDGMGDLPGIISRLDYLQKLGVSGIWLSPVFRSPQADNGYDISDYCAIDPIFGTMEDMEELIRQAGNRNMIIILDLVLNHSSDQHPWFQQAKQSRENPFHSYYIWRDGSPHVPPNDMKATFGGSAWTYVPEVQQYYFHQFTPQQPDLNWEHPGLRKALYDAIRFWVQKGVGGFRLDVIDQIAKEPDRKITANGPRLHEFIRELSREAFGKPGLVTVGEAWSANVERARAFSSPDGRELSMVFQFEHICLDQRPGHPKWDTKLLFLPDLKLCMERWQQGLHGTGWNSLFLNNHDLPRIVSRWGDDGKYRVESAKMLAMFLHGMEGTPYIYQGEELGMTNIRLPIEDYQDVEILNYYQEQIRQGKDPAKIMEAIYQRGRDNARTPMQWEDAPGAGFTQGKPWLPVNPNYREINARAQTEDPDSVYCCYQNLIRMRKELPVVRKGDFTLLCREDPRVFAYERKLGEEGLLVVCNFSGDPADFQLPATYLSSRVVAENYPGREEKLRPWEGKIYYRKNLSGVREE